MYLKQEIRDCLQQWARWRRGKVSAGLDWPTTVTLGKFMDGMRSTTCKCRGRDADCPLCDGSGTVKLDPGGDTANPAFLRSTYRQPDDEQSQTIDRILCELRATPKTRRCFLVLWAEYVWVNGTQEMKAERLRISHGNYRYLLHVGHERIEVGLENVRRKLKLSSNTAV